MCSFFPKAIFFTFIPSNKIIIFLSLKSDLWANIIIVNYVNTMNVFIRFEIVGGHSVVNNFTRYTPTQPFQLHALYKFTFGI